MAFPLRGASLTVFVSESWEWDDESIPSAERVYRRILRRPNYIVPNLLTGQPEPGKASLQFDKGDGMSVHLESLRAELGVEIEVAYDWSKYHVIEFDVECVRSGGVGGVIQSDDPDDEVLGKAHGVVRTKSPSMPRSERDVVRDAIIDRFRWIRSTPQIPGA